MKVKNISARLHWVGDVMCIPGEIAEIDDSYAAAINAADLVFVDEPAVYVAPATEHVSHADKPKITRRRKA